jgi:hypothetical protein
VSGGGWFHPSDNAWAVAACHAFLMITVDRCEDQMRYIAVL